MMNSSSFTSSPEPNGCLAPDTGSSPSMSELRCSSPLLKTAGLVAGPVTKGTAAAAAAPGSGMSGGSGGGLQGGAACGSASSSPERCSSPLLRSAGILATSAAAGGGSGGGQGSFTAGSKQRRGQGLGVEKGDGLSRAFRSMLLPAREVSRMGWAPLRPTGDDTEAGGSDLEVSWAAVLIVTYQAFKCKLFGRLSKQARLRAFAGELCWYLQQCCRM